MLSYVMMLLSVLFHMPFQLAEPDSMVVRTLLINLGSVTVILMNGFCVLFWKP